MSKYMDTFADATVETGSMTSNPAAAAGTKKKIKIDPLLLQSIDVTTSLLLGTNFGLQNQQSGRTCETNGVNTCQSCPGQAGCK